MPADFIPPLAALLAVLLIWRAGERVRRVADAIEAGLVQDAVTNYRTYAKLFLYAGAASLGALGEQAEKMGWPLTGAVAKILQPAFVAIIANLNQKPA